MGCLGGKISRGHFYTGPVIEGTRVYQNAIERRIIRLREARRGVVLRASRSGMIRRVWRRGAKIRRAAGGHSARAELCQRSEWQELMCAAGVFPRPLSPSPTQIRDHFARNGVPTRRMQESWKRCGRGSRLRSIERSRQIPVGIEYPDCHGNDDCDGVADPPGSTSIASSGNITMEIFTHSHPQFVPYSVCFLVVTMSFSICRPRPHARQIA